MLVAAKFEPSSSNTQSLPKHGEPQFKAAEHSHLNLSTAVLPSARTDIPLNSDWPLALCVDPALSKSVHQINSFILLIVFFN